MQRVDGRKIGNPVHALLAEMALKSLDVPFQLRGEFACNFRAVTIEREHRLQRLDRLADIALLEEPSTSDRRRFDPMTDACCSQSCPREFFARIDLADRGDIGVPKHTLR